jgi:hypothetical protein
VPGGDVRHDGQSEAGPVFTRREAVFEDALVVVGRDAGSIVGNEDTREIAVGERSDTDPQVRVAGFHGVIGRSPMVCRGFLGNLTRTRSVPGACRTVFHGVLTSL